MNTAGRRQRGEREERWTKGAREQKEERTKRNGVAVKACVRGGRMWYLEGERLAMRVLIGMKVGEGDIEGRGGGGCKKRVCE